MFYTRVLHTKAFKTQHIKNAASFYIDIRLCHPFNPKGKAYCQNLKLKLCYELQKNSEETMTMCFTNIYAHAEQKLERDQAVT